MIAVRNREATFDGTDTEPSAERMAAAERYLTEALLAEPTRATLYYWRGRLRQLRGATRQADADYTMALARGFDDKVGLLIERARLHADVMDHVRAEADYASAIARTQSDHRAYAARSRDRHRRGDHEGAVEDISCAIGIQPDRADSYYDRSAYLAALDRFDEALVDLERALELDHVE